MAVNNKTKVWDLIQETNITKLKATYNETKKKLNDALELVETRRLRLKHFEFTEFYNKLKMENVIYEKPLKTKEETFARRTIETQTCW